MSLHRRSDWSLHVDNIIRSGHFTWIGEGQAGQETGDALASMLVDMMHICQRENLDFQRLLEAAGTQFAIEQEQCLAELDDALVAAESR